jgi:hypothetical protein
LYGVEVLGFGLSELVEYPRDRFRDVSEEVNDAIDRPITGIDAPTLDPK